MRKRAIKTMQLKLLNEKLLEVVLLLVGLSFFRAMVAYSIPLVLPFEDMEFSRLVLYSSPWIANTIFGLVIFWLARRMGLVAISVGVLSIVLPSIGAIFYIMTTLNNETGDN